MQSSMIAYVEVIAWNFDEILKMMNQKYEVLEVHNWKWDINNIIQIQRKINRVSALCWNELITCELCK